MEYSPEAEIFITNSLIHGGVMKRFALFIIFIFISFFIMSCQRHKSDKQLNAAIDKYISVWNGVSLDSLDTITSQNFQLRINPDFERSNGRDKLKESITQTRYLFPDFNVQEKDRNILSDTAAVVSWEISGTYKNPKDSSDNLRKTKASGFSVIFYNDGILTGEWIAYSDLNWNKSLSLEPVKIK
jgi:hypothetical protein